jgi:hypothetical protein
VLLFAWRQKYDDIFFFLHSIKDWAQVLLDARQALHTWAKYIFLGNKNKLVSGGEPVEII